MTVADIVRAQCFGQAGGAEGGADHVLAELVQVERQPGRPDKQEIVAPHAFVLTIPAFGEHGGQVVAKPCRDRDIAIAGVGLRGATRECVRRAGEAMDRKQSLGDPNATAGEVDAADPEPAQLGGAHTGVGKEPNRRLLRVPDVNH